MKHRLLIVLRCLGVAFLIYVAINFVFFLIAWMQIGFHGIDGFGLNNGTFYLNGKAVGLKFGKWIARFIYFGIFISLLMKSIKSGEFDTEPSEA